MPEAGNRNRILASAATVIGNRAAVVHATVAKVIKRPALLSVAIPLEKPPPVACARAGGTVAAPPLHTLLQIAEQERVIGLQRFAQSQLVGASVCTAGIDPAMHGAIGLFGRRLA
jgi:hypothetical protein